ncbi:hypothetical protein O5D80_007495 [Batrachochytrium dendrobatidis]|nr:hypothetical protein O5D80_007495 [Batrachochytrium dendrobatidis]
MTRLYIQYLENTPVSLFTQKLPVPEGEEPDISDLVAAYKAATTPRFENIPVDELTIHFVVDGPAIPGNTLLTSIQHPVGSYDQPLVIKSGIVHGPTVGINDFVRKGIPTYWKVSGALSDSLAVKGVCSRMYRNVDNHLATTNQATSFLLRGNKPTLKINVLFKTEENVLRFDSHLRNESITINSPMNSLTINSSVSTTSTTAQLGERIYCKDYIPTDSESPQDTQSKESFSFQP